MGLSIEVVAMSAQVIELVTFRIRSGIDEATFRAAVETSMPFLLRQAGFLGREVGVSPEGEWTDIVRWADMDTALRAAAAFNSARETRDFNSMLDGNTVQMRHLRAIFAHGDG
jgi:hypothetical protein